MKYEIETPDGVVPEGYEPVAFRVPCDREEYIASHGNIVTSSGGLGEPRLILRQKWQWPKEWAFDKLSYSHEYSSWVATSGSITTRIDWDMFEFELPPDKTLIYHNPRKDGAK